MLAAVRAHLSPRRAIAGTAAIGVIAAAVVVVSVVDESTDSSIIPDALGAELPTAFALDDAIDFSQPLADDSRRGTYLGELDDDPDVFVAITTDEGLVRVYVCDGDTFGHWFSGEVYGNSFDLVHPSGARVSGALSNGRAVGRYTRADGTSATFEASFPTGDGGLFRADRLLPDGRVTAGWIVHDDGDVRGVSTVTGDETSETAPAPEIDAAAIETNPTATLPDVGPVPVEEITPEGLTQPQPTVATSPVTERPEGEQIAVDESDQSDERVGQGGSAPADPSDTPPMLAATFEPAAVAPGATTTWLGVVSNPGKVDLVDVAFGLAFPDPIVPDLASVKTDCDGSFLAVDPKVRLTGDPQVAATGILLPPGASCTVSVGVTVAAGAFKVVSGAPTALNATTAGPVAVAVVEASAAPTAPAARSTTAAPTTAAPAPTVAPKTPDSRTPAITIAADAEKGTPIEWTASASVGSSPLSVVMTPAGGASDRLVDWSIVYSDGTGQTTGKGALVPVPHTFVNDGTEPVVFHADLTGTFEDKTVTRHRLSFTVAPKGSTGTFVVSDVTAPMQRGRAGQIPIRIVNLSGSPISPTGITAKASPSLTLTGSGAGWRCNASVCDATSPILPNAASAPLVLTAETIPLSAPASYRIELTGGATGIVVVPVEGFQVNAGPDQTVDSTRPTANGGSEPNVVILDGSGSTSSIGRPRTFTWRQVAGPAVTLDPTSDPSGQRTTFTVPTFASGQAVLEFELTVSDGVVTSTDRVAITVLRVNRAPSITLAVAGARADAATGAQIPPANATSVRLDATVADPDRDPVTVTWSVVGLPAAPLTANGTRATLTWPIRGVASVQVEARATDSLGRSTTVSATIGATPPPVTLAVTSSAANASAGSTIDVTATPSRASAVAWTQVSGPPVTAATPNAASTRMTLPADVTSPATVVIRATATPNDGAPAVTRDLAMLVTPAQPVSVILAPQQSVGRGATVTLRASAGGAPGTTVAWSQVAGPDVTFTAPTGPSTTFTAPNADTVIVVRATATANGRSVSADQLVNVGTLTPVSPAAGCSAGSVLARVFAGDRVLPLGTSTTAILGDVGNATGTCAPDRVLTHSGSSVNLFNVITGDDLSGTIDGTKICFDSGTVQLNSKFDLPPITLGAIPLCIVFASVGATAAAPQGFRSASSLIGAPRQDATCEIPLTGELRWTGEVPFVDLPAGIEPIETVLGVDCDRLTLTASAAVESGGTLTFDGEIGLTGSGSLAVAANGVEVAGGSLTGQLEIEFGASVDVTGEFEVLDPDIGIDGLTVERLGVGFADGRFTFVGDALVGDASPRLAVSLAGEMTSLDDLSLTVSASTTSAWEPQPGLRVAAASITGRLTREDGETEFDVAATATGDWVVVPSVTVRQVSVRIGNATPPSGCAGIEAGDIFVLASGVASIAMGTRPPLSTQIEACLGLPSGDDPSFALRSTTSLPSMRPDPAVDFSIDRLELRVEYVSGELEASLRGDGRVLGITLQTRLVFRTAPTGDVLVALATGNLASLGTPITTGTIVFASQFVRDLEIDDGVTVDVPGGLSLISTIDLGAAQRDLLNDVLKPPTPIAGTLVVSATLGGSSITFTAAIDLGPNGIELFRTCPAGTNCAPNNVNTTRFQINNGFIALRVGASGFQLGIGGEGTLFLPPAEARPGAVRSEIDLAIEAFFRPPAEVGLSFALLSDDGWQDAVGIRGLTVNALVAQGSIDFTVPNAPVPSIGILAEVSRLPDELAEVIGFTNNGESVRLALNIAPKNPIVDITIGQPDDEAVLRPLAAIDGPTTDLDEAFEVDHASLVFAPLGGAIGPITYSPGVSLRFGATILGTEVDVNATVDVAGLRIIANVAVGSFPIGGMVVEDTQLLLDLQPLGGRIRLAGGVDIEDGPQMSAVFDIQAGVLAAVASSAPLPSTTLPRPTAGLSVVADLTATRWTVAPGTALDNLELHAEATIDVVDASFDAVFSARADGTVMGQDMDFAGEATFADGRFEEVHLRVNPGVVSVGGVSLSGDGRCQASLVAAPSGTTGISIGRGGGGIGGPIGRGAVTATTTTTVPRVGTSGPCFQFDWVEDATPAFAIGFRGTLTAGSVVAKVRGVTDARKADLEGTVTLGELGDLDVNGVWYHGADSTLTGFRVRVRDEATTVVPQQGSWRIDGQFDTAKALKGVSIPWKASVGSVDPAGSRTRTTWAMLDGEITRTGFFVKVKGNISFSGSTMQYSLLGTSALKVEERSITINPNPNSFASPDANSLHTGVRGVVFTLDPSPPSHQDGVLEEVIGKLYGSASYAMTIDIRHDRTTSIGFSGSTRAQILYSESFKRGSARSFVEEPRDRWNTPLSIEYEIDTATGRACFRWGEPGEFATIVWGTC